MCIAVVYSLSRDDSFVTPRTVACQALLSIEFSRQEYWCGLPFPTPEDLPDPGVEPASPALTGGFFTTAQPGKLQIPHISDIIFVFLFLTYFTLCDSLQVHPHL